MESFHFLTIILMKTSYTKSILFIASLFLSSQFVSAHWTPRGGPQGGRIKAFAIADTTLFIATPEGGVYRSTNQNGTAWRYCNYTGMSSGKTNCLAGLGKNIIAGSADSGIFVSNSISPGGVWMTRNTGLTSLNIGALAVSGTTIYAGTKAGVFVSADTGNTWTLMSTGITNLDIRSLAVSGTIVFAGTYGGGIFASINSAATWAPANTGIGDTIVNSLLISGTNVYAGTNKGIFKATTVTPNWAAVNTGFYNDAKVWSMIAYNNNLYSASTYGIYMTPEASINWANSNIGLADTNATAVIVFGTKMFTGTNTFIYSSPTSSLSWATVKTGFTSLKVSALCTAPTTSVIVTATNKGVFVSLNEAALYTARNTGLTDSLNVTALKWVNGKLFAGTLNAGMFMSADTGKNWVQVNTGLTQMHVTDIVYDISNIYIGTADSGVFRSQIATINWSAQNAGLTDKRIVKGYAGNNFGVVLTEGAGVFVIKGASWVQSNVGLTNMNVTDITSLYNHLYVSTDGGGIFRSDTGTIAWTAKNTALPTLNIYSLGTTAPFILAGYHGGVQATYDSANAWVPFGTLLYIPNFTDVKHIAFTATRIVVSTPNNSVYSNSTGELPYPPPPLAGIMASSDTVCVNTSVSFIDTSANAPIIWDWDFGDGDSSSVQNPLHTYTASGTYTVMLIATNVGGADTAIQVIEVEICTGVQNYAHEKFVSIYPNPSNGEFNVIVNGQQLKEFSVYDAQGKLIERWNSSVKTSKIDLRKYPQGNYILKVTGKESTSVTKLVME